MFNIHKWHRPLHIRIVVVWASSGAIEQVVDELVVGSSEATYEEYTMSKRVDNKIQNKVKYLEANLLWIFPRCR
jgi:hypothetical protein